MILRVTRTVMGLLVFAATILPVSSPVSAQSSQAAAQESKSEHPAKVLPSADKVLDNYVKAIGGREAWKKLSSRISTGTIDVPAMNLSGTIEIREKAPDRIVATITFNSATFSQGYDGAVGWTNDTQNGIREQTGEELAETKRDADFYHPLDLRSLYTRVVMTGTENLKDREAYVIEATTPEGETDKMYFDPVTGLVLRIIGQHHMSDGVATFTEDLSDYREIDGI